MLKTEPSVPVETTVSESSSRGKGAAQETKNMDATTEPAHAESTVRANPSDQRDPDRNEDRHHRSSRHHHHHHRTHRRRSGDRRSSSSASRKHRHSRDDDPSSEKKGDGGESELRSTSREGHRHHRSSHRHRHRDSRSGERRREEEEEEGGRRRKHREDEVDVEREGEGGGRRKHRRTARDRSPVRHRDAVNRPSPSSPRREERAAAGEARRPAGRRFRLEDTSFVPPPAATEPPPPPPLFESDNATLPPPPPPPADDDMPPPPPPAEDGEAAMLAAERLNKLLMERSREGYVPIDETTNGVSESGGIVTGLTKSMNDEDMFFAKVDINDFDRRYLLTKGDMQTQITRDTGAVVITKGEYYQMRVDATDRKPPLFLLITAPAKDMVEAAVKRVRDIMDNAYVRNSGGFPGIKIPVEMELDPTFNIKAKIIGDKGVNVKHIQQTASCYIQLHGRGSGYVERETGRESDEPMYMHVTCKYEQNLETAEQLCRDLLKTVQSMYDAHQRQMMAHRQAVYSYAAPSPYASAYAGLTTPGADMSLAAYGGQAAAGYAGYGAPGAAYGGYDANAYAYQQQQAYMAQGYAAPQMQQAPAPVSAALPPPPGMLVAMPPPS